MSATAWIIGLHLATWHSAPGYEAATFGVYARDPQGITLGAYRNSEGRPSVYAGMTFETPGKTFAVTAGLVSGYRRASLVPMVVPSVRFPMGSVAVRVAGLPKLGGASKTSAVHVSIERSF